MKVDTKFDCLGCEIKVYGNEDDVNMIRVLLQQIELRFAQGEKLNEIVKVREERDKNDR